MMTKAKGSTMVDDAVKAHEAAVEAVRAAETALKDADDQLRAALVERDRLDKELDGGADIDAADLAAQIGANGTTVEALSRLKGRRQAALREAREAAETAGKRVPLARLQELRDDLNRFDLAAEKARLVAAVQDDYARVVARLYDLQDRIAEARSWAEEAQGVDGARVKPADKWNSSSPTVVDGRPLVAPAAPSSVLDWLTSGLVDERAVARKREGEAANRARYRETHAAQARHAQAQSDAMPRVYGDTAEAVVKAALR